MANNLKSTTKLVEIETGKEWKVERRTRGKDGERSDNGRPLQTWIIILANPMGHKQFVPEERIWTLFRPFEQAVKEDSSQTEPSEATAETV